MILSAMMFALGAFVSGLLAILFFGAYARRTQRVVERRLRARLAIGRAEIDAERDEIRARHAVEVRRLEREIGHLRDEATAYRLDGDIKEQELVGLRADVAARYEDISELEAQLDELQDQLFASERLAAERAGDIRVADFERQRAEDRLATIENALEQAGDLARDRWREVGQLLTENRELRSALIRERASLGPEHDLGPLPASDYELIGPPTREAFESGSLAARDFMDKLETGEAEVAKIIPIPLPNKADTAPSELERDEPAEAANIRKVAAEIHRLAGEAAADLFKVFGKVGLRKRLASVRSKASFAESRRRTGLPKAETPEILSANVAKGGKPSEAAEDQFYAALDEIKSLKRAGETAPGE